MFNLGRWGEIIIIVMAVLVLVGPKDLPKVISVLGRLIRKIQLFSKELKRHADSLIQEAEFEEYKNKAESEYTDDIASTLKEQKSTLKTSKKKRNSYE
jgi:sec-independent protein translocase protein TatB